MASGKLSPRQKMINMMYLVLTALLALNVSAEILQAFESLRSSLAATAEANANQNSKLSTDLLAAIEKEVKNGNEKHKNVIGLINGINEETVQMVSYLNEITDELADLGEKDPVTGEVMKKDITDANYRFWMGANDMANGGRGEGKALEMKNKLDDFVKWANEFLSKNDTGNVYSRFDRIALDPKDDPAVLNAESKSKTWEYHTFHGKPIIADMAMMEKYKMDIRSIQSHLLEVTKGMLKNYTFPIDSLIAFEAPSANVVAAGMEYQTRIIVGVSAKNFHPEFHGNGIKLDQGGSTATLSLTANGNVIPDGQTEGIQKYTAMVRVPMAGGGFQELPINGQFKVRKPEVVVRSRDLQILYKDCGNAVTVDVPALGDSYNPDFSTSTGGKVIQGNSVKDITIVPSSREFNLNVYSNTNGQHIKIDKIKYNVIKPPLPRLILVQNGREIDGTKGIKRGTTVTVKLLPDPEFLRTLPRDARYTAGKINILLKSGITAPKKIHSVSASQIQQGVDIRLDMRELKAAGDGAGLFFEVEDIKRVNFQNHKVEVDIPMTMSTIPGRLNN